MKTQDPVCGMDVLVTEDAPRAEYKGQEYFFCSAECLDRFQTQADQFLKEEAA
jgi:YHS domain-containing protein